MEYIVLELSSDKSIFLEFMARDVQKYRCSIYKKIRIPACRRNPVVQNLRARNSLCPGRKRLRLLGRAEVLPRRLSA
jgi:hypothetical protein